MSINKFRPHVWILPEDDADRQIAHGFLLHLSLSLQRIQVASPAGGWRNVLDVFKEEYVPYLRNYQDAHVVLLIDFDKDLSRRDQVSAAIPDDVRDRVFVVGPRDEPETLRQALNMSYESIGVALADDCDRDQAGIWAHEELRHNEPERRRLHQKVRPFLFGN